MWTPGRFLLLRDWRSDISRRARSAAEHGLQLRPDHGQALAVRGTVHLQTRQFDEALGDFRRALGSGPDCYFPASGMATPTWL
jgi:hypothetical protein